MNTTALIVLIVAGDMAVFLAGFFVAREHYRRPRPVQKLPTIHTVASRDARVFTECFRTGNSRN